MAGPTLKEVRDRMDQLSGAGRHAEASAIFEKCLGSEHIDTAICWSNLGTTGLRLNDGPGARDAFTQALPVFERLHGPDHPEVAAILEGLAQAQDLCGDLELATKTVQRALGIMRAERPDNHPDIDRLTALLSHLHRKGGNVMFAAVGDYLRQKATTIDPEAKRDLFLRACREVFRDGVVEARENLLLQVLMAVLELPVDAARELGRQACREAREHRLPDDRISGRAIYERALFLLGSDEERERAKPRLEALRKVIGLPE